MELEVRVHRVASDAPAWSTQRSDDDVSALLEGMQAIFAPAGLTLSFSLAFARLSEADLKAVLSQSDADPQRLVAESLWDETAVNVYLVASLGGKNCMVHRGVGAVFVPDKTTNSAARAVSYGIGNALGLPPSKAPDGLLRPGGQGIRLSPDEQRQLLERVTAWLKRSQPIPKMAPPFCCEGPFLARFIHTAGPQGKGLFASLMALGRSPLMLDESGRDPWIEHEEGTIRVHDRQKYDIMLDIGDRLSEPSLQLTRNAFGLGTTAERLAQPAMRVFALFGSEFMDLAVATGLAREHASLVLLGLHHVRCRKGMPAACLIQQYAVMDRPDRIERCCHECSGVAAGSLALQAQIGLVTTALDRMRTELTGPILNLIL
ncbi:MAG TPA: hypothetical protein VGO93_10290 [Candidatus Xenobia bacterium]|jgi:hypothetical protein